MIRVLVFVNDFEFGGVSSLIKDIYRRLERKRYRMDFIRNDSKRNEFDDEVQKNGDKVYYTKEIPLGSLPVMNYLIHREKMGKQICKLIGKERYDAAYIHANARYAVPAAKKLGIPIIIMHSHEAVSDFNGNEQCSFVTKYLWNRRKRMYNHLVTYKVGDSEKACVAKFGTKVVSDPAMFVISPPINYERFSLATYADDGLKEQLHIENDALNMIHVGRISNVKNQTFLMDVLDQIRKTRKTHLFIVGEGDRRRLEERAKQLGVYEMVTFLPGDTSPAIYKYMDCSLLPSFSEAFGMVAVESQLMRVPCFASTSVSKNVDIGMCVFIALGSSSQWAQAILDYDYANARVDEERENRFRIDTVVARLEQMFEGKA